MAYINCPKCGSINRDSDSVCFSCQADLGALPPPPPTPPPPPPVAGEAGSAYGDNAELSNRQIGSGNHDAPRFKDLAKRYEAKPLPNLDSNLLHGVRSGIVAGILVGAVMGLIRTQGDDGTLRLMAHEIAALHARKPVDIVIYSTVMDFLFGAFMGAFLGLTNRLCFMVESSMAGAVFGAIGGGLIVFFSPPPPEYLCIPFGLVHGYILAWLTSGIERKVFRGL